jgi:hypothetical protein
MPLILPGNVATATASTTFSVANSCRFNSGDSPSLKDGDGSAPAGNRQKFTFSIWFKRAKLGATQMLASAAYSSGDEGYLYISSGDTLEWDSTNSGDGDMFSSMKLRDTSAWYHLVWSVDTTQSTAGNRMKFYLNGTQMTSWSTETQPNQNQNLYWNVGGTYYPYIGRRHGGDYWDGYLAEIVHIDNAQLAATSFGEFDEDSPTIWKPKDVSGLTFGTAGYHLDFEDSGELGKDVSGQGNHFGTVANLAATDQSTDTCTNNFATWNNLINSNGSTSEGNVKYVTSNSSSNYGYRLSTIGMSSGKWYAEVKYTSSSNQALIGIRSREATAVADYLGKYSDDYAIYVDGVPYNNNSAGSDLGASWTNGDIIGIFLDLDNNKLYFSKNGSLYSSTGISITAAASTTTGFYFFSASEWNSSGDGTFELNTGGSPSFSLTSAVNDGDYGNFEYTTTITGDGASKTFKALNTKNLAEYGG